MKLHMQTPHESRMCPLNFEVKRSKVKVTMHKLLKIVPAGGISPVRTDPDLVKDSYSILQFILCYLLNWLLLLLYGNGYLLYLVMRNKIF